MERGLVHGFVIKVGEARTQVHRLHEPKDLLGSFSAQIVYAKRATQCPQF